MPKRMYWLGLIWAAALFLLPPRPVSAQQAPTAAQDSDDEEDEKPAPVANLTVTLSEGDRAHVNFYMSADSSNRAENLAAARWLL